MKTFIPKKLQSLTPDDLRQLNLWLDDHPYKKIRALVLEHFAITVSDATLCRYLQNRDLARCVSEREEDQAAIEDLTKLTNGQPVPYAAAGLELILKRAFDAVCHPKCSVNKLALLQRIFHYKTNLALLQQREQRHATDSAHRRDLAVKRYELALHNAKIREESLALRRVQIQQRAEPGIYYDENGNPCDDLGPLAVTCEDIETRTFRKFKVPESEWPARRAASKKAREELRAGLTPSAELDCFIADPNQNFTPNP